MKQILFCISIFVLTETIKAQNVINWNGKYKLQLSDFQSSATEIGKGRTYSLRTTSGIDFSFYMTNAEFIFTKNFNSKVSTIFNRDGASLLAPDSLIAFNLINFARFEFDLSELYARKFRKRLHEEKGAFSSVSFFRPIYDEIQREFTDRITLAGRQTELGRDQAKLAELHHEVVKEIEAYSDYCKNCKPPKKKK